MSSFKTTAAAANALAQADACIEAAFAHEDANQWDAALAAYRQALALAPDYWRAHVNLGNALKALGQLDAAHQHYQSAYTYNPQVHSTCYNLGADYVRLGRMTDAIAPLQRAVELKPDFADAMVLLAEALDASGPSLAGVQWLQRAAELRPDDSGIWHNLFTTQEKLGLITEGEHSAWQLTRLRSPTGEPDWAFLAEYCRRHGEVARALPHYQAMPAAAFSSQTYDNYLLTLSYIPDLDPAWLLAQHRGYRRYIDTGSSVALQPRSGHGRRRVGFISPDFYDHPVTDFVLELFERLDRSQFELHAYHANHVNDAVTQRLRRAVEGWHEIAGLSPRSAAELIAADQIDILIDLTGHMGGNCQPVLAFKPAPVIATWLGYLGTTGMDEVDFRIVDPYTDPVGLTEAHHSEQLVRLPHSQWCYLPPVDAPPVSALPAQQRGYVTFGSPNNYMKLSDAVLRTWAQLLARVPRSRLSLAAIPHAQARARITQIFAAQGVSAERLDFLPRISFAQFLAQFQQIDVALDPSPYTGGTTTCNALYMGVPVLTLAGQHSVARSGVSLMTNVGLPEWVCGSPEAFVEQGARLVADLPALARTRAGLRQRMMASPVGDQARFARDFGALLHEMWQLKGLVQA